MQVQVPKNLKFSLSSLPARGSPGVSGKGGLTYYLTPDLLKWRCWSLEIEPGTLCMKSKWSTNEPYPHLSWLNPSLFPYKLLPEYTEKVLKLAFDTSN